MLSQCLEAVRAWMKRNSCYKFNSGKTELSTSSLALIKVAPPNPTSPLILLEALLHSCSKIVDSYGQENLCTNPSCVPTSPLKLGGPIYYHSYLEHFHLDYCMGFKNHSKAATGPELSSIGMPHFTHIPSLCLLHWVLVHFQVQFKVLVNTYNLFTFYSFYLQDQSPMSLCPIRTI